MRFPVPLAVIFAVPLALAQTSTVWQSGNGSWTDRQRWTAGIPTPHTSARIRGNSRVTVPEGSWKAADLRIGTQAGDRSRVELNGGQLDLAQDSLIVGEDAGGQGEFLLNSGSLHSVMDVFIGGGTASTRRANDALIHIRGGSFLGRTLSVGYGYGSHARVEIEGSRIDAIDILDYVELQSAPDPGGRPGLATLAFTLDEHGVRPIRIRSRLRGLRISARAPARSTLEIALAAVPPREDITLVTASVPAQGVFDGLPEGSEITAAYAGHVYRWTLTYRGGPRGADLVLRNCSAYTDDAPVTHVVGPAPPLLPRWRERPLYPLEIAAGEPAFPGAEGYGAYSRGGKGGRTLAVDNLNDSGPGSLRAAVEAEGPRIVAFRVGGAIDLETPLRVTNPYLTIDAQSALGEGITLRHHGIQVRTHDVVLRYFRIRIGDEGIDRNVNYQAGEGEDALRFESGAADCIADHLSLSWSTGKIITTTLTADRLTIQWCILSESLNFAGHGYAALAGGARVTWHHNLLAHNFSRNIRFQGALNCDFRNNTIYDWGETAAYGEFDRLNYTGNYLKPGPSTTQRPRLFHRSDAFLLPRSIYLEGNVIEGEPAVDRDNWRGMGYYYFDREQLAMPAPFTAPAVNTEPAREASQRVLAESGAVLPVRDATDRRIVKEVADGTGRIINSVREAGR
jgi:hypothetical protein